MPNAGSINNIPSFGEDAAGEIYIVDLNGEIFKIIPDNPTTEFTLLPLNPGRAGTTNTLQVTGATPGGEVTFIWGFNQSTVPADSLCGGLEVDITNFRNLATVSADRSGNAFFNTPIPGGATGISILIQAVDIDSCTESNLEMETL